MDTDLSHLQYLVVDALEDVKAQDIQVFDTTPITTLFDRVVIASGTSNRQTRALAKSVHDKIREAGAPVLSIEGTDTGEWVLVDLGDVIVHIMQPAIRDYYRLEDLWGEVPVPLDDVTNLFRKKMAARKSGVGKPVSMKPPTKTPASEAAAGKKPSAKKPAEKTPAAKKPAAIMPAAKKRTAK